MSDESRPDRHALLELRALRAVQAQWDLLARAPAPDRGQAAIYSDAGRAVFPASL